MKTRKAAQAVVLVAAAACGSTGPGSTILKNDNFSSGTLTFAGGFAAGEAAAVRLGPLSSAFTIMNVRLVFGGAAAVDSFNMIISNDVGTDAPGGTVYHAHVYTLTPSDAAMQEIDLSGAGIVVPANTMIRIALFFKDAGVPSVAPDLDGIVTARNFIYDGSLGWIKAETASVTGDWIIRAEVQTN